MSRPRVQQCRVQVLVGLSGEHVVDIALSKDATVWDLMYALAYGFDSPCRLASEGRPCLDLRRRVGSFRTKSFQAVRESREWFLGLMAVRWSAIEFQILAPVHRQDVLVALAAIRSSSQAVCWADVSLLRSREFLLGALRANASALQWLPESLRDDEELVVEAARQDGSVLRWASERLRRSSRVVTVAVKSHGDALRWAASGLQGDEEIVLAATAQRGAALQWAAPELRGSRSVALHAIGRAGSAWLWCDDLRGDRSFMLQALEANGHMLKYLPDYARSDKEMIARATRSCRWASKWALAA